jgi:cullin 1
LTVQQIQIYTEIKLEILIQVLKILFKVKLLLCDNNDNPLPETVVTYNKDYKHKKIRININVPIRSETKEEDEKTHRQIDESRKYVIEAAIVRIMKMRKTLKHQDLIREVLDQIGAKFSPTVPMIKKGIDDLLNREYLERANGKPDEYNYIA